MERGTRRRDPWITNAIELMLGGELREVCGTRRWWGESDEREYVSAMIGWVATEQGIVGGE